jgi:hypothetical protein
MTHSLHRRGSEESLQQDYVFLCTPAKGVNNKGALQKLIRILDILMEVGPSNIGFYGHGSLMSGVNIEEVKKSLRDTSRLRCCFDDKEKLEQVLRRVKSEDLGLSITVSGLISELNGMARELSLKPHTINISCGCFGKVERLPPTKILEISTMCGHGMISYSLVESIIKRLREATIGLDEATRQLGEPCTCGIFNPSRAHDILQDIIHNGLINNKGVAKVS